MPENFNWNKVNQLVIDCTKESKLKWFQYRIVHRILGTNDLLFKCKIKNNPMCSFCNTYIETIEHLFFFCRQTKYIWLQVENWIKTVNVDISFDIKTVLFGFEKNKNAALNSITIYVKQYIFQQSRKQNEMSFCELKRGKT